MISRQIQWPDQFLEKSEAGWGMNVLRKSTHSLSGIRHIQWPDQYWTNPRLVGGWMCMEEYMDLTATGRYGCDGFLNYPTCRWWLWRSDILFLFFFKETMPRRRRAAPAEEVATVRKWKNQACVGDSDDFCSASACAVRAREFASIAERRSVTTERGNSSMNS